MGSFIIPSGFNGLSSPRTIYIDNGAQLSLNKKDRTLKFGDGYKQIVPISNPKNSLQATFSNRPPEEINLIEAFFIYLAGSAIPDLTVFEEEWVGTVESFNKNYNNGQVYSLTAIITEL